MAPRLSMVMAMLLVQQSPGWMSHFFARRRSTTRRFRCRQLASTARENNVQLVVPTSQDMQQLGAVLFSVFSQGAEKNFTVCLDGDLGAGKTKFCQGFIRAATRDWDMIVTSPTYLLSNTYIGKGQNIDDTKEDAPIEIRHMDLYRLSGHINDLLALDLDYVFSNCISLIEWPSRLGEALPSDRLEIHITIPDQQVLPEQEDCPRQMLLQPFGNAWYERLNHLISEGYVDDLIVEEE